LVTTNYLQIQYLFIPGLCLSSLLINIVTECSERIWDKLFGTVLHLSKEFRFEALFGSRVDHRKRIGIENRRIGKQARSSGIIPLICLGHKPPRASRDEHEVRPDFSFPACTVRAIPFPVDFLRKVSRETKDMLTSSIPILSYPVFALRFAREPKEA